MIRYTQDDKGNLWASLDNPYKRLLDKKVRLDELTYKQVIGMIDDNFLQQKVRAAQLEGVKLAAIEDAARQFVFMVRSSEHNTNGVIYANNVRFHPDQWDEIIDDETDTPIGRARLIMYSGHLMLNCTCPSFLYHGYRYIADRNDASIFDEIRPPKKNNPQQRGIVCKHLHKTIKAFPFYAGDFAKHIKDNYPTEPGKRRDWDIRSRLGDIFRDQPVIDVDYRDLTGDDTDYDDLQTGARADRGRRARGEEPDDEQQ